MKKWITRETRGWSYTPWVTLSDAVHRLELAWQAASAPGADDGGLTFWLDEVEQAELAGIENDTRRVDYVQRYWGCERSSRVACKW